MANLAIFAGVRKDITQMPEDEQEILTNLLLLLDKYDLYGKDGDSKKERSANWKCLKYIVWLHAKKVCL